MARMDITSRHRLALCASRVALYTFQKQLCSFPRASAHLNLEPAAPLRLNLAPAALLRLNLELGTGVSLVLCDSAVAL